MNNLNINLKNRSILCIEKDKKLQNKIYNHLKQTFNNIYQSSDGLDGINKYTKYKPDIVILDLSLEKINSIEVIVSLKELNSNLNIIIISGDNDNYKLLKNIDFGLSDIMLKPISLNKLDFIIKRILTESKPIEIKKTTIDQECFSMLKTYIDSKINLINSYKGILLQSDGSLEHCEENMFQVKVSKTQLVAAKNEKFIILKLPNNRYIYSVVLKIDLKSKLLTLVKPEFIDFKQRDKIFNRVVVDNSFKATIFQNNNLIELDVKYISFKATSLSIKHDDINIKVNDKFDLTLGFDLKSPSSLIKEKKFTKIFAEATVIRIDKHKNNTNIIVLLNIQKAGQNTFKKYLQQREIETIHEFKNRLRA